MATNTDGGTTTSLDNTPQAKDDSYIANEDEVLYFSVMANDLGGNAKVLWSIDDTSDDGSGDLVAKDVATVCEYSELGAKISLTSDGLIKYDTTLLDGLAAGQTVTDQFTYAIRLSNGTLSWATVTVTLTGTNDGPVAVNDVGSGSEDTTIMGNVATNDSDVDFGAVLSYAPVGTPPAGFTMNADGTWSLDASDAAYQHIAAGETQQVVVTYTVTDEHGESATATLTITVMGVNDGPVAIADSDTASENAVLTVDVLANDTDVDDGAVLTVTAASAPAGQGTASIVANQVQFDPGTDFDYLAVGASVDVVISYSIEDEHGASSSSTLTITVTGTNDGPVAVADLAGGHENELLTVDVLANDTDVDDGAVLTVTAASAPAGQGTASIVANQVQFDPGTDFDYLAVGASVDVVISYSIEDEHGASSSSTLTITVTGTNDQPVAVADEAATDEDTSVLIDVLANDSDPDTSDVLAISAASVTTGLGSVTVESGHLRYDPGSDYNYLAVGESAEVVLSYTVEDGNGGSDTASVTVTVTGTNDNPALTGAQAVLAAGTEDTDYNVTQAALLTGFSDPDSSDVLAVFGLTADHGTVVQNLDGSYTITPDADYNGPVTLSYSVIDGNGGTVPATLSFNLAAVNDPAVITGDFTGSVIEATPANPGDPDDTGTVFAADVDNPPNTFIPVASTATASGYGSYTMSAAGVWTYTLNNANATVNALATGMFLIDTFTVQSADGTTQTISVTINGATDAIVQPPTENGADPNDFDTLAGGAANNGLNISLGTGNDTFTGGTADQSINGNNGDDTIYGGGGADTINGGNNNDVLYGQAGVDDINGNGGVDTLYGGSEGDSLTGSNENDTLYGGSGSDTLNGSNGDDILIGGYGADTLTGGNNDDTFRYLSTLDTNDIIIDFMIGNDQIDVSAIDAIPGGADDAFAWGGTTATANALWFEVSGTDTILFGDTDGNAATAEFMITLQNFNGFAAYSNPLNMPPDITF